jgi:hypothetical protein
MMSYVSSGTHGRYGTHIIINVQLKKILVFFCIQCVLFKKEKAGTNVRPPAIMLGHKTGYMYTAISKKVAECFVASCIPRSKCTIGYCECNQGKGLTVPEISKIFLVLC